MKMSDLGTIEIRHIMKVKTAEDTYSVSTTGPITQQAILWCTTHDSKLIARGDMCQDKSWSTLAGLDSGVCVISTGGPEHKWWRDI